MIYDRRLYIVSFLKASLLEKLDFCCCLGVVCTVATRNITIAGLFFFRVIIIILAMCIR
jgi:hypothetical protein